MLCPFRDCLKYLKFMSCRRYDGKVFHTRGPAAEKLSNSSAVVREAAVLYSLVSFTTT